VPSFFETLGNIVSGKPVFTPGNSSKPQLNSASGELMSSGPKVIKQVQITEVDCVEAGTGFECWISVHNNSNDKLDLNKLDFLGRSTDLQTILMPGEERKFKVYQGPHLLSPGPNTCNLEYIDSVGDYFIANHNVTFRQIGDGTHEIDRINFVQIWDK
jgi:hypothetical protein